VGEDEAKKPKHDDKARVKRHDSRNARGGYKIIFLANGEQERERSSNSGVGEGERFSCKISSAMLSHGDSLSLTGSRDLHNYVEGCGGRLTQPIFLHGLPLCQLFGALMILKFEVAKKMLIVSCEINVDLLWE